MTHKTTTQHDYATATPLAPDQAEHYQREERRADGHPAEVPPFVACMPRRSRRRPARPIRREIERLLDIVNGQRRTRLLDVDDVCECIATAIESSSHTDFAHGGHVANSYKYPATATACLALRVGSFVYVAIREVSATKGSTGFGRIDSLPRLTEAGASARDSIRWQMALEIV